MGLFRDAHNRRGGRAGRRQESLERVHVQCGDKPDSAPPIHDCSREQWYTAVSLGGTVKLGDIAQRHSCELRGNGDIDIRRVAGIDEAREADLAFISNPKYAAKARTTSASAVIVSTDFPDIPAATL